jgi:hypothetical protein
VKGAGGADKHADLNAAEKNLLMRNLLSTVIVKRAGRGARVPLAERGRVMAFGADIDLLVTQRGERAAGIAPVEFPEPDAPGVLA